MFVICRWHLRLAKTCCSFSCIVNDQVLILPAERFIHFLLHGDPASRDRWRIYWEYHAEVIPEALLAHLKTFQTLNPYLTCLWWLVLISDNDSLISNLVWVWVWVAALVAQMVVSACNVGNLGSIPGSGRYLGEGNGSPLQYSCLENSMDGRAWQATVHRVAESQRWLEWLHFFLFFFWG